MQKIMLLIGIALIAALYILMISPLRDKEKEHSDTLTRKDTFLN